MLSSRARVGQFAQGVRYVLGRGVARGVDRDLQRDVVHFAGEQVLHDQPARRAGDRGVGEHGSQVGATEDGLLERRQLAGDRRECGGVQRAQSGGGVSFELGQHDQLRGSPGRFDVQRRDGFAHEVLVRTLVHFTSDDLVDQFEDDLTDARRRLVDGALARGVDFGVGVGDDPVVLGLTATGRFGADLIRGRLGGGHDLAGLVARRG